MKAISAIAAFAMMAVIADAQDTSFSGRIWTKSTWAHTKTAGASIQSETFDYFLDWTHASSTNSGAMNRICTASLTLSASGEANINLAAMPNVFGDAVAFGAVKFLCVQGATNEAVQIGGAAADAFDAWLGDGSDSVAVAQGGTFMLTAPGDGYTVGSATNLLVKNLSTNAVVCHVYIGGVE